MRCYAELQPYSEAAPTGPKNAQGDDRGLVLCDLPGVRLCAHAPRGQTLTGGQFQAYLWHPVAGFWVRWPALDVSVAEGGSSGVEDFPIHCRDNARVLWCASGVTATGTPENPDEADKVWVRIDGGEPRRSN